jgi:hypothetical protein
VGLCDSIRSFVLHVVLCGEACRHDGAVKNTTTIGRNARKTNNKQTLEMFMCSLEQFLTLLNLD